MKKLLAIVLLWIMATPCYSQEVDTIITIEIFSLSTLKFSITEYRKQDDTLYEVKYNNLMWVTKTNLVNISLDKTELKNMVDSLFEIINEKYQPGDRTISINGKVGLRKIKYQGIGYYISSKEGFTKLNRQQIKILKEAIYEYFGYKWE
ncbi:MAG: hypothetical protein WC756_00440 [Taibaiella sp.]|jgi:hypothetical protein